MYIEKAEGLGFDFLKGSSLWPQVLGFEAADFLVFVAISISKSNVCSLIHQSSKLLDL